uniref:Uncharacterized protein n=1 Tax=Arundo donax TaxID=35708 RepID=A0A0A9H3T7_ARUDO
MINVWSMKNGRRTEYATNGSFFKNTGVFSPPPREQTQARRYKILCKAYAIQ